MVLHIANVSSFYTISVKCAGVYNEKNKKIIKALFEFYSEYEM